MKMGLSNGKDGSELDRLFPEQDLSLFRCSPLAHMTALVCASVSVHLSFSADLQPVLFESLEDDIKNTQAEPNLSSWAS